MKHPESKMSDAGPRPHLLVVDDEAPIREVLRSYLEKHDYRVTTSATGAETLRLVKLVPVDLIMLDVLLEDADGLDLLAKVKRVRRRCPVIIITGLGADAELKSRALENRERHEAQQRRHHQNRSPDRSGTNRAASARLRLIAEPRTKR